MLLERAKRAFLCVERASPIQSMQAESTQLRLSKPDCCHVRCSNELSSYPSNYFLRLLKLSTLDVHVKKSCYDFKKLERHVARSGKNHKLFKIHFCLNSQRERALLKSAKQALQHGKRVTSATLI